MKRSDIFFFTLLTCFGVYPLVVHAQDLPRKVLMVVTSQDVLGKTGRSTGLWFSEFAVPYEELVQAGYAVEIASPKGGKIPIDPSSLPSPEQTGSLKDISALDHTAKLSDLDPSRFAAVIFTGGHGSLFDFFHNPDATRLAKGIWRHGGIVAALGEGSAALLDVRTPDGKLLLEGKMVTCFSLDERKDIEKQIGQKDIGWTVLPWELEKRGALVKNAAKWESHILLSERLLTGQNPASAAPLGKKLVELLIRNARKLSFSFLWRKVR